ncbi:uncharacterized protein LOC111411345 [Olea europaea var. sylvestris]|uniref:uncharacterized protein LOC111411345 n=1 Tax=Olea europaea var. sylvestris TaxID=158386 RepID=UPI000C1D323D|nr:uncharacterized protein LOC111411345 [Olea europaea var. sylvestris]
MEQFRQIGKVVGSLKALMIFQDDIQINQRQYYLLVDMFTLADEIVAEQIEQNLRFEEKNTKWQCLETKNWWGKAISLFRNKDCVQAQSQHLERGRDHECWLRRNLQSHRAVWSPTPRLAWRRRRKMKPVWLAPPYSNLQEAEAIAADRNCRTRTRRPEASLPSADCCASSPSANSSRARELLNNTKKSRTQFNVDDLVSDPGIRPPIKSYDPNIRDDVRMTYLEKGPCQPYGHDFPRRPMRNDNRCFRKEWFSKFHWLEYNIEKDAAYCLHCYLLKPDREGQGGGHIFTKTGFRDWKHKKILKDHVGLFDSAHNKAFAKCTNLMIQKQSISYVMSSQSSSQQQIYRTRLNTVLDYTRFILMQGLSFRGHDESKESLNRENLIELLNWYAARCKEIKEVLFSNAPGNDQMTSPTIQKDLVNFCAVETTRAIINEIGDSLFSILVDEARDNSMKEQMAVVLRFVDKSGQVNERFLDMFYVTKTCAQSLKDATNSMFSTHRLSISSLRGQGYDGASICQHVDAFRTSYQANILEKLNIGELTGGSGQFQEMSLARPDVLENILEDGIQSNQKSSAKKDQDIQNAMRLLNLCKCALQNVRENAWDTFLSRVIEFCVDRHILVSNMEDIIVVKGRPRRVAHPRDSFAAFDKNKLLRLAQFYLLDFNSEELLLFRPQLDKFLLFVRMDEVFFNLNSISCIVQKLVGTGSFCYFPLVYRLLILTLILPVATASVERVFSAMNLIKSDLRNKIRDDWLNNNLLVYVEKAIFKKLENETIL